jgi:hypothetical protein
MPTAAELFKQGKKQEIWQMCCGFLSLNITEFMEIQKRLLLRQIELLNNCPLGEKIMGGKKPQTVDEFRQQVPLTTYKDYTPELLEKREDMLPQKPAMWVHSSGKSGEYAAKWVPITADFALEMSKTLYGIGVLSGCKDWGDTSNIPDNINILYSVAPRPYISGTFADLLRMQWPFHYLPPIEDAETLTFEERTRLGLQQAMGSGIEYYFGLSLVLVKVGEKMQDAANKVDLRPFLRNPKALWRLTRGKLKSRLAGRPMLPRDLWSIKGIIGSGVDSLVYKEKIKELWGRPPLDLYSCTEAGIIAMQAWDYEGMNFIPQLNFLEFIPEDEQLKWQMDRSYKPQTLLLDEVEAGENYEIVITNFHGGVMTRYRVGDMIRITALADDKLGIKLPQMCFERRVDDIIDFFVVRFTEKTIWQAIESTGIAYEDWIAYRIPGETTLRILIELRGGTAMSNDEIAKAIYRRLMKSENEKADLLDDQFISSVGFTVGVTVLSAGSFANYTSRREAEGADLAHIKPPHVNPAQDVISILTADREETIFVAKTGVKLGEKTREDSGHENISVS